LDFYLGFV